MAEDPAKKTGGAVSVIPGQGVSLFETFLKNFRISKTGSFLLSLLISLLLLYTESIDGKAAAKVAAIAFIVLIVFIFFIRLFEELRRDGLEGWSWMGMLILGFSLGVLIYLLKAAWVWLWTAMQPVDTYGIIIYIAVLLFGVMMGVFVVRIWNKEEKDFTSSLTSSLGGAIITPLLGKAINVDTRATLGLYLLGLFISGSINILVCWRWISEYSKTRSASVRSGLDYMYGKDKARAVDNTFLENFNENKDIAKRMLTEALKTYRDVMLKEYAERLQLRFDTEQRALSEGKILDNNSSKRKYYYNMTRPPKLVDDPTPSKTKEASFEIKYMRISRIEPRMIRVGITAKVADNLEYVVPPSQFQQFFPYKRSVAGLALKSRKTIVMGRDINKPYSTSDDLVPRTPEQMEQPRSFMEARYLSYISIPVVSNKGNPGEEELGVVNVDSVLFANEEPINGKDIKGRDKSGDGEPEELTTTLSLKQLREYANNLYDEIDDNVYYLEELATVITPILRLYLYARSGSS